MVPMTDEQRAALMAAASAASSAAIHLISASRQDGISSVDNVGGGEVLDALIDAAVLVIQATGDDDDGHLRVFLLSWQEGRGG